MSSERYLAIMHPLKAKYTCTRKRAKMIVLFIWLLSLLAASPILIGKVILIFIFLIRTKLVFNPYSNKKKLIIAGEKTEVCFRVWCEVPGRIFEIYRTSLLLLIPFSIMLVTYSVICIELWEMPNSRRSLREEICSSSNIRLIMIELIQSY